LIIDEPLGPRFKGAPSMDASFAFFANAVVLD